MKKPNHEIEKFDLDQTSPLNREQMKNILGGLADDGDEGDGGDDDTDDSLESDTSATELSVTYVRKTKKNRVDH
ncbi:hypothetical protein [Pedobacter jeongneungensis]|uniref:hypothetical protein n=1 Tax=Pedobacter jeongneungensis TaxID=947309 RepID=UPI0004697A86|nr:hypothetical protein [Pedobacter jeongneungensis]